MAWAKRLFKAIAPSGFDLRHITAESVIDITMRRFMLDYGSDARLYAGGEHWHGRSGRSLATLHRESADASAAAPLWLLDLTAGIVDASDTDIAEDVCGTMCRRVLATADLSRMRAPPDMGGPSPATFEDPRFIPVGVWLDVTGIRRVRRSPPDGVEDRHETIELWDLGVAINQLDWTRLPTFRSPDEATRR